MMTLSTTRWTNSMEYKKRVGCTILSIENALEHMNIQPSNRITMQRSDSRQSILSSVSSRSSDVRRKVQVKLPKLELSKFSGKVCEW